MPKNMTPRSGPTVTPTSSATDIRGPAEKWTSVTDIDIVTNGEALASFDRYSFSCHILG